MADKELDKAIADAAEEITSGKKKEEIAGEEPEVTLDKKEVEGEEDENDDSENEGEEEESELSEDEKGESARLYRALKDPKTAGPIIAALAQQAGLLSGEPPKSEAAEKKAVKTVKDILAEGLGKDFAFLADRLGPAIEAVLEQERTEQNEKFAKITQSRIEDEVVAAYNALAKETKGESRKLEAQMAKLSGEIAIGTMSVNTYIKRLYTLAAADKSKASPKAVAERIRRNANDATSRLHNTRGAQEAPNVPKGKMNINQAVDWALQTIAAKKEGN